MSKLYLIDGMSIVFRAYHAMAQSNLKSPTGEPTGAVFSFVNIITSFLEKEKPEHIAVVFDRSEPTFRHIKYPLYKANRAAFPEELVPQLARIKEFLDYLNIKRLEMPGYEADDIIGTLSKIASGNDIEVACLTSDKDYYQLVNDKVKLYKPGKKSGDDFDIVDIDGVYEKFGVPPVMVIDVLALIGDTADNIPGVKGVGDKTAIPLIQSYGSIEGIYDNIDKIENTGLKNKLIQNKESAFLAKELVTIITDVPLDTELSELKINKPDYKKIDELFANLGFHQIRKKWQSKAVADLETFSSNFENSSQIEPVTETKQYSDISKIQKEYFLINTFSELEKVILEIEKYKLIALDTETSSLDRLSCDIVGISLCAVEGRAFYIATYNDEDKSSIQKKDEKSSEQSSLFTVQTNSPDNNKLKSNNIDSKLPIRKVVEKLNRIFNNQSIGKCGQNIKFDTFILQRFGAEISPIEFDSMIASFLLNPDDSHNLDALSKKWLNYSPIPIENLIGEKKSKQISMADIEPEKIYEYACEDADFALRLRNKLYAELEKENLKNLAEEVEFPLIEVLTKMERNGITIDTNILKDISEQIKIESKVLTENIYKEAGIQFNIDSPKQLGHILFEKMQIPATKRGKTGYSTDVQVLTDLAEIYPIANMILEYRQLTKLKSTYVDALPQMINHETKRIHTTYNQTIAGTGRLSSIDPNLQNIPIRTELGRKVRLAFIPERNDCYILSADYSQIELRIMAYYSKDENLKNAFIEKKDIHSATASILFDTEIDRVDSNMRRVAKTVNFGIMYGLGSFGLAQRLGLSKTEAQGIIDNYFNKYPGIKKYIEETIAATRQKGYAETLMGRRKYYPNIKSNNRNLRTADERAAINMPIQGTAADMLKIAMLKLDRVMVKENLKSMMLLQVHDELVFEVFPDELDILKTLIKQEMENALPIGDIPVVVEIGVGKNWYEAH
ncbi:MAG: DNA polymerase I [Bacteroidetes bacterium]|nr:MAG: DNA polymerase I [Bacteroidota bacterium]